VLVWVNDARTFGRYLEALGPVVARYGGAADRVYTPTAIHAAGLGKPDAVNLVHYDSEPAYRLFTADPDFLAIKPMRDNSIQMLSFEGTLETCATPADPQQQRLHRIEILPLPGRPPAAPGRDGARTEYLMRVTGHPDDHPASLVRISSFPSQPAAAASGSTPDAISQDEHPPAAGSTICLDARLASLSIPKPALS
jgi:hypothetical protein